MNAVVRFSKLCLMQIVAATLRVAVGIIRAVTLIAVAVAWGIKRL